ncbi:hypothetical protein Syun_010300 [Stephania yunnanensis]|uniref:magnesium chelatase n=1 Tax=Stephania yunnanensis TaxID=152371 RepID=A0AAP0PT48_9MAGN
MKHLGEAIKHSKLISDVEKDQYQSSLSAAVRELNNKNRYASFEVVGYLAEELRDESTYKTFRKDLEDANVFSGSLIFVEELAQKIKSAVEKERDRLEALFKRKKQSSAGFADSMLKLVRTLSKVLKYLPSDKAQYARTFEMKLCLGKSRVDFDLGKIDLLTFATFYDEFNAPTDFDGQTRECDEFNLIQFWQELCLGMLFFIAYHMLLGLQDKIQLVPIDLWKRPAWYKEKVYPKNKKKMLAFLIAI